MKGPVVESSCLSASTLPSVLITGFSITEKTCVSAHAYTSYMKSWRLLISWKQLFSTKTDT